MCLLLDTRYAVAGAIAYSYERYGSGSMLNIDEWCYMLQWSMHGEMNET